MIKKLYIKSCSRCCYHSAGICTHSEGQKKIEDRHDIPEWCPLSDATPENKHDGRGKMFRCIARSWIKGGTAVTNFDLKEKGLYEKAIEKYGGSDLAIGPSFGYLRNDENYCALHCSHNEDLSKFWRIFDKIKDETTDEQPDQL